MLTWVYEEVLRGGTPSANATFNTQVEAQKKRFAGDAYQFLWSTPPLRLMFLHPCPPQPAAEFWLGHSPHSGPAIVVRLVWHDHVSRRRYDMRPYANSFQILAPSHPVEIQKKKNKSRYGWVWFGRVGSLVLSVYLCARFVPVNVSDPLCVTCTVFCLPTHAYRVSHTHRVSHSPSHTFILFPRTYQCGLSWHKRIIKIPNYFFLNMPMTPLPLSLSLAVSFFLWETFKTSLGMGEKGSASQRYKTNSDAL